MKYLLFVLFVFVSATLCAQEGNVSAGGEYSGPGGTMSNSTGQTDFITMASASVSLQFGLQQVFFEESGVPTDNLVQNIFVGSDENECFNATQTITVAGSGTTFVIENGATVDLIAGHNIIMFPGMHVHSGGYLHARITTDGYYCDGRQPVTTALPEAKKLLGEMPVQQLMTPVETTGNQHGMASFKVYPNPTSGLFTLDLTGFDLQEKLAIKIYGLRGECIMQKEVFGDRHYIFSLEDQRSGIYLIQLLSNELVGTKRIIKL